MNRPDTGPGPILLATVLVAVVVWLWSRAGASDHRSRKLGFGSVACGLAAFIPAVFAPALRDSSRMSLLVGCGILAILFAVAAIALAIGAFRIRRRDRGVAVAVPAIGLLGGFANLICGVGVVVVGSGALLPSGGNPRSFRLDEGFEVTLPTDNWSQTPNPNVLAAFRGSRPPFMAIVAEARPARSDEEYEAALAFGRGVRAKTPLAEVVERSGPNRHGHPHEAFLGWANGPDGTYYFGVSVTRVRDRAVVLMFEGQSRMSSEIGRARDNEALRTQSDIFLGSIH